MRNVKSNLIKVLSVFVFVSCCVAFAFAAKVLTAQEKLEKGQSYYEAGNYDRAMEYFLDVFVEGNIEQINTANEYVDMIHFKRGGVSAPVRVNYDEQLEEQKEAYKQEAKEIQKEMNAEYDRTIQQLQEGATSAQTQVQQGVEDTQNALAQTKSNLVAAEEDLAAWQKKEEEKLNENLKQAEQDFNDKLSVPATIEVGQEETVITFVPADSQKAYQDMGLVEKEDFENENSEEAKAKETIVEDRLQYDLSEKEAIINKNIADIQKALIAKLNEREGVNVYLRNGKIDAIDIDSEAIFLGDNITFSQNGKEILEDVYKVMLLSKEPVFVLLPPGSYTDDVNLQGVRQVVALNSYLINMGLSSAKVNFNMGLLNEQPPAKFSNLEGISIVFDYDNKPVLYNNVSDKQSYPILSLGMYPEEINPELGQGMVIDFSVVETAAPIDNWKLQIVRHGSDGKYYIVRQLAGEQPVYEQIFWNGKKNFFGEILPAGRYTLLLRAKDTDGKEKIVRRKVRLLSESKKAETAIQENKPAKVVKQAALDYSTPRLWTKPAKILKKKSALSQDIDLSEEKTETTKTTETYDYNAATNTVTKTVETTTTTSSTQNSGVVNPSATPDEQGDLAYDPSLEDVI